MTSLACEMWLTIGTERFWQISAGTHLSYLGCIFPVSMILRHNKCHMKEYTYTIVSLAYLYTYLSPIHSPANTIFRTFAVEFILIIQIYIKHNIQ